MLLFTKPIDVALDALYLEPDITPPSFPESLFRKMFLKATSEVIIIIIIIIIIIQTSFSLFTRWFRVGFEPYGGGA